jgi:hypothetical protein
MTLYIIVFIGNTKCKKTHILDFLFFEGSVLRINVVPTTLYLLYRNRYLYNNPHPFGSDWVVGIIHTYTCVWLLL